MARTYRQEIAVGVFIAAAAVVLGYLAIRVGGAQWRQGILVQVASASAAGLVNGSDVMTAGVRIGSIQDIRVEDGHALLSLRIDPEAGLRRGARATVRSKSLLGEKYLELTVGQPDAPPLAEGDRIDDAAVPADIDQLVANLNSMLEGIDPAQVQQSLQKLTGFLEENREQIGETVENLASFSAALNRMALTNEEKVNRIVGRVDEMTGTLSEDLPPMAADLRQTGAQLRALSAAAQEDYPRLMEQLDGLVSRIDTLVAAVPPETLSESVSNFHALSAELRAGVPPLLDSLQEMMGDLRETASSVRNDYPRLVTRFERIAENLEKLSAAVKPEDLSAAVSGTRQLVERLNEASPPLIEDLSVAGSQLRALTEALNQDYPALASRLESLAAELETFARTMNEAELGQLFTDLGAVSADVRQRSPELLDDFSVTLHNLRQTTTALNEDYEAFAGRLDRISTNLEAITGPLAERSPQLLEDTTRLVGNLAAASEGLPQAVDNLNQLSPEFRAFLIQTNLLLQKANAISREDIERILTEVGVRVRFLR